MEGPHLLNAAVAAGVGIETIFSLEGAELPDCDAEVVIVTDGVLDRLAPTDHPRGPIAVFRPEPRRPTAPHAMVLWGLSDPGNAGTLIRTAAAFGVDIFVTPGTVDLWSPKVLRAASGAHFSVGFGKATQVSDLTSMGYRVIAAVATGGAWPDEVRVGDHGALVIGSEAHGLPSEVAAAADIRVSIPMPGGVESFNAGVAGSILAYTLFSG